MNRTTLLVIIPAHSKVEGVRPTVERLYGTLMAAGILFEILVVNDHSANGAEQVLQALARELPGVRYVNNPEAGGIGRALQTEQERFRGDAVCIVMADASDDPQDVVTYYRQLENTSQFPPEVLSASVAGIAAGVAAGGFGRMRFAEDEEELAPTLPRRAMTLDRPASVARLASAPEQAHMSTPSAAHALPGEAPPWVMMLAVAAVAWALIVSRRPDAIFNAQFWAEDGIWFSQAYNLGAFHALLIPYEGYLCIVPRLTAAIALLFPILYAPLIFNIIAILVQASPAIFLFSGRFDHLIPSRSVKLLLAFLYVALPNSFEINATITNSQWHISVLTCMIVLAAIPKSIGAYAFDIVILLLSGLNGPICVALAPIIVLRWVMDRRRHTIALFIVNAIAIGVQALIYLPAMASVNRVKAPLGASPLTLARLLAGQVFIGATLGMNQYARIAAEHWWDSKKVVVALAVVGLIPIALALWKGANELRLFLLYCGCVYGLCLISPLAPPGVVSAWIWLTEPAVTARYEYIPMLGFVVALVWLLSRRLPVVVRTAGALVLIIMLLIGVPSDWQYPPFTNLNYGAHVAQFNALPAGSAFTFPINPSWSYTLHKH